MVITDTGINNSTGAAAFSFDIVLPGKYPNPENEIGAGDEIDDNESRHWWKFWDHTVCLLSYSSKYYLYDPSFECPVAELDEDPSGQTNTYKRVMKWVCFLGGENPDSLSWYCPKGSCRQRQRGKQL